MPEKDISRKVVERTLETLERVRARVGERVPYGPKVVALKPSEYRKRLAEMTSEERLMYAQQVGIDKFLDEAARALLGGRR